MANLKEPLSSDRILDATVDVLRRFGPDKTSMVDVGKALGVTHGSLYRYFPDKEALFDAVIRRWLHEIAAPLPIIAGQGSAADERLRTWLLSLIRIKHDVARQDPEMFAKYHQVAEDAHEVVGEHLAELRTQIARIIEDGNRSGTFAVTSPEDAARAILSAAAYYHHPFHVLQQLERSIDGEAARLVDLLVAGLPRPK